MVEAEASGQNKEAKLNPAARIWNDVEDPDSDSLHMAEGEPSSFTLDLLGRQGVRRGLGTSGFSSASGRSSERDSFFSGGGDHLAWDQGSQWSDFESSVCSSRSSRRNTTFFTDGEQQPDMDPDAERCCNFKPALDKPVAASSSGKQPLLLEGRVQNSATPRCAKQTKTFADPARGKRLLSL